MGCSSRWRHLLQPWTHKGRLRTHEALSTKLISLFTKTSHEQFHTIHKNWAVESQPRFKVNGKKYKNKLSRSMHRSIAYKSMVLRAMSKENPYSMSREGKPLGSQARIGEGCTFHSFRTNNYKLHFFESPSGIKVILLSAIWQWSTSKLTTSCRSDPWSNLLFYRKDRKLSASLSKQRLTDTASFVQFILNTDNEVGDLRQQLAYIYESIYVEYVIKNPIFVPGKPIE